MGAQKASRKAARGTSKNRNTNGAAAKKADFKLHPALFYAIAGILALCALVMVISATSLYGPGLTSDSVSYISTARNIASGAGFNRFDGTPFIAWPPLYPIVLSISGLLGGDVTFFSRVLGGILFGAIVFLSILLAEKVLNSRAYAFIAGVVVIFSTATLNTAMVSWSEPLFTALVLAAALFARRFRDDFEFIDLLLFSIFTALACLTRYSGVAVFGAGFVFLLMLRERPIAERAKYAAIYAAISVLPLAGWLIRNKIVHGTMTGARSQASSSLFQNIGQTLKVMGFSLFNPTGTVAAVLFLIALGLAGWAGWSVLKRKKSLPFSLYMAVFYVLFLILTASFISFDTINDRLITPVLPFAVILFVRAILIGGEKLPRSGRALLLIPLFAWILVMSMNTGKFISDAKKYGAGHYNSDMFWNSPLFNGARSSGIQGPVYSNFPDLLYINTDLDARWTPMKDGTMTELTDRLDNGETVTMVWFFYERGSSKKLEDFVDPEKVNIVRRYNDGWIGTYRKPQTLAPDTLSSS